MAKTKKKVVMAMSGGVDSSVAASLLIEKGYEVSGVSLRMWDGGRNDERVCSNYEGAKEVASLLGIPYSLLDLRALFLESVVKPFALSYLSGKTPNPCVSCNRDFKLGFLLDWARKQQAEHVATGHYARIVQDAACGRYSLLRGRDRDKDQSYFLFGLSQEQLAHTLFPLGEWRKGEVRKRARELGLPVAERPESQDICFGDHRSLVESYAGRGQSLEGEIVDRWGKSLGSHSGIHRFTVGQRKGLGVSASHPLYVLGIEEKSKQVIVGKREDLGCAGHLTHSVNWFEP
ncbi:MAG TPA: tRNA 2-thiouridine(34) synthase MnmA, partial [Candidatus Binatia bacterium]